VTQTNSSTQKKKTSKKSKSNNSIETLHDAFIHELSDMQNAEKQLTKALPKMAKAASDPELAQAFETHLKETEHQVELIAKAVKSAKIRLKREKCDAMEGLIEEGSEIIKNVKSGAVRDAMLIAAAQKVEHYEIASYGCLVSTAKQLGFTEAAEFLDQILNQEKQTDRKLNRLAEQGINEEASMQALTQQKGTKMARYERENNSNGGRQGRSPERDEEGRFMSDDDRGYGRGRDYSDNRSSSRYGQDDDHRYSRSNRDDDRYSSRSRDDYDDDRSYSSSSRGRNMPQRDDEGRFMSDDDRGGYRQSRSRNDRYDSDEDYNGGRHSRASNDDDYDDNRSSRRSASGGGQGRGWFGDPEGHARAGRHSHDNNRSSSRR
jgi:ferritin-like metal-binding protein YciE